MERVLQEKNTNKALLWDCGSSLYDSFELKSFKQQLDSAISSRTFSMSRLPDPVQPTHAPKKPSKVSRSLSKLLRSMFRLKSSAREPSYRHDEQGYYGVYLGGLHTIPEVSEMGVESPEFDPVVRKTVSERFTSATAMGSGAVGVS